MQITVVEHPLIKHKLSKMRDINSTSRDFREWLDEIAMLMTYEVTRDLELDEMPPHEYYCKIPPDKDPITIVVDPMLATGGSAEAAITMLKKRGLNNIRFMCLVAAPEGVEVLNKAHPDVKVYTAALDEKLNEHGYIVPGLGDAGDRIFGTK